jgi:hypothetical protein
MPIQPCHVAGPPFLVTPAEVDALYGPGFPKQALARERLAVRPSP